MQRKDNKLTVIASVLIIYGALRFLPTINLLYFTIKHFDKIHISLPNFALNMLDGLIFPLAFIVGGIFTLRLKNFGRILLLITISVDLAIRLFAITAYWYQAINISKIVTTDPEITIKFSHVWHIYIIILFELIFLFYLTRPKVKELFKRIHPE